jgi:hypothetical protein
VEIAAYHTGVVVMQLKILPLADGAPASDLLPPPDLLLDAMRGHRVDGSLVIDAAYRLGVLYRDLIADPLAGETIRMRVGGVVGEIDTWISGRLPRPRSGVPLVMDTVGGAISHLAEAWETAWWALHHLPPADLRVHRDWEHLAQMKQAYADFIGQVLSGAIEVPTSWPGISSTHQGRTQ